MSFYKYNMINTYNKIDNQLFVNNRLKLKHLLQPKTLVIIKSYDDISNNVNKYQPNNNLFYLSGIDKEESILLIYNDGVNDWKEILFIRDITEKVLVWEGEKIDINTAQQISGIEEVYFISEYEKIMKSIINKIDTIYIDVDETQIKNSNYYSLMKKYSFHRYKSLNSIMTQLRMYKDDIEIELIKKACNITMNAYKHIESFIKPDIYEYDLQAEFASYFIKHCADGFAYRPIIASGKNNCKLHYDNNNNKIQSGDLILMDVACGYANYKSDVTRTLPANGVFTKRQEEVYNSVLNVFNKTQEIIHVGMDIKEYRKISDDMMFEELYKLKLISPNDMKQNPLCYKKYWPHGISHHLGLDVHDIADYNIPFNNAMVFTIEPGIYIPEENFGIRHENTFLIRNNKIIDLCK